jgi:hypothetical protein
MGFFSHFHLPKLRLPKIRLPHINLKSLGTIAKIAAPIAASFVPGGSIAMGIVSRLAAARSGAAPALRLASRIYNARNHPRGFPGLPSYDARESIMSDANGLTGGVGRRHAGEIYRMRRTRRFASRGIGIGTRATYQRVAYLRRMSPFKGRTRAYGGRRRRRYRQLRRVS